MTLQELYSLIGGDYDQAMRVLRVEKLLDKHIRRFAENDTAERLLSACVVMDQNELFEAAHALKGVSSNLGLTYLTSAASEISEEFRSGNGRTMSDDEVKNKVKEIRDMFNRTVDIIKQYEA